MRLAKNTRTATKPQGASTRDHLARGLAIGGIIISGYSACTQRAALQDTREAAIKIESDFPSGGALSNAPVVMRVKNLRDRTITDAKVETKLAMLPPGGAADIYRDMHVTVETIQPEDTEPQTVYPEKPYTPGQFTAWWRGDMIIVSALRVTWKPPGAWFSTTHQRCFAFTPHGDFACEDLINDPANAQAYVDGYFQHHPELKKDWIGPPADGSPSPY